MVYNHFSIFHCNLLSETLILTQTSRLKWSSAWDFCTAETDAKLEGIKNNFSVQYVEVKETLQCTILHDI